ncbi:MAG TPA: 2,3-butanediol dehydrogenase [Solirubrobacter sp.]|nr:2,3-butanediol dehydrogenase [Solirubrobacter sp.]
MKAAVYHGPRDIRLEDVPEPGLRPGSVKVKVDWCGICGTDLHEYLAGPIFIPPPGSPHPITGETLPVTLGHEFAGSVVEVASDVTGIAEGDAVAIEPVYRCGVCTACRRGVPNLCDQLGFYGLMGGGGGMSEYAVMPAYMIHGLDGLTAEQGALVEPIAVGLRAVRRAGFEAGQSAVVFGAGPIGAVTIQCLKAYGAGQILVAEVSEARKRKALEIGADAVIDPTEEDVPARVRELTGGDGADHSFDAAGIQATLQGALSSTRKGGVVTIISIWEGPVQINPNDVVLAELDVRGTIAYTPEDFADTIAMLKDGRIDTAGIVTERIELADVVAGGFDELVQHKDRHVKILVRSPT